MKEKIRMSDLSSKYLLMFSSLLYFLLYLCFLLPFCTTKMAARQVAAAGWESWKALYRWTTNVEYSGYATSYIGPV
jgi:hypothetical protein